MRNHRFKAMLLALILPLASLPLTQHAIADETCLSPYTTSLIKGQEKYLQVWTLGAKGMGDESDKLVTIDVGSNLEYLWEGHQFCFGRRPWRSASHGLHRRP